MFNALSPGRLIDTRDPAVPAIGGGAAGTAIQVAGQQGVPATGATAVVVNITATGQNGAGFIKAYPDQDPGTPRPASVNLNYPASGDLSGLSVVKLGADGKIRVYSNVTTDVVIDVFGWYSTPSGSGNAFTPATPIRLLQTTDTAGVCTPDCGRLDNNPTGSNRTLSVKLAGEGTVPATGVTAVSVTLTAVNPSAAGHIRLWASGDTEPAVSNINFQAGQTIANAAIVKLGNDGYLNIRSINADTDVIIDVNGWYTTTATDHWQYHYNGDGTRTQKIGADTTTNYTYTPTGLPTLLKETAGNQTTYYIYGPTGAPLAQINPDGTTTYHHHDQLGSTRALTSSTGTTTGTTTYDPYGKPTHTTGTTSRLGWTGQYQDPETGHTYLRARYYDPTTGTFLTRDPIETITREPYGYVGGNPLNATDPSGLVGIPGTDLCIDILDDNCRSNADGKSLRDTFGRASTLCQMYCDDVSNYSSGVAAVAGLSCPLTAVGCVVAPIASGVGVASSAAHMLFTCADGFGDEYCMRSLGAFAVNAAGFGLGAGAFKALRYAGESSEWSLFWGQLSVGDYFSLWAACTDTTERPDTEQRHRRAVPPGQGQ